MTGSAGRSVAQKSAAARRGWATRKREKALRMIAARVTPLPEAAVMIVGTPGPLIPQGVCRETSRETEIGRADRAAHGGEEVGRADRAASGAPRGVSSLIPTAPAGSPAGDSFASGGNPRKATR